MKILKYTKLKNNKYRVDFESESLELYDDVIIKYELLLKKKITDNEFQNLKQENQSLTGYYLALKYLNSKMRTKKEIKEYLKKKEIPNDLIESSITKLENLGYLNEKQYTVFYINDSIKFSKDGPDNIRQKLKNLGIEESMIEEVLEKIDFSVWKEKMEKLISKRITSNHSYSAPALKNKLSTYLYSCGYPREWTTSFLQNLEIPKDETIILKEKEKLIRKLSRKYAGDTLIYQIRMKLLQKGFSKDEIDKVL